VKNKYEEDLVFHSLCRYMLKKSEYPIYSARLLQISEIDVNSHLKSIGLVQLYGKITGHSRVTSQSKNDK